MMNNRFQLAVVSLIIFFVGCTSEVETNGESTPDAGVHQDVHDEADADAQPPNGDDVEDNGDDASTQKTSPSAG